MWQLLASKLELVSNAVTMTTVTMTTASNDVWQVLKHPDVLRVVLSSSSDRSSSPEGKAEAVKWQLNIVFINQSISANVHNALRRSQVNRKNNINYEYGKCRA